MGGDNNASWHLQVTVPCRAAERGFETTGEKACSYVTCSKKQGSGGTEVDQRRPLRVTKNTWGGVGSSTGYKRQLKRSHWEFFVLFSVKVYYFNLLIREWFPSLRKTEKWKRVKPSQIWVQILKLKMVSQLHCIGSSCDRLGCNAEIQIIFLGQCIQFNIFPIETSTEK